MPIVIFTFIVVFKKDDFDEKVELLGEEMPNNAASQYLLNN